MFSLYFIREEIMCAFDERLHEELTIVEREMSELGGLTALDFFTVDRSLLTAILGTTLTYLIILHDIRKT
jgi:hypothetical protein